MGPAHGCGGQEYLSAERRVGSAPYLAAGLTRGLHPSQARCPTPRDLPGPMPRHGSSAPWSPPRCRAWGWQQLTGDTHTPRGRAGARISATFGLAVGGREVSDPLNPLGGVSFLRCWYPSSQPAMCCSLFIPASLLSAPCQSSTQSLCQIAPLCCHPSPSPPCLSLPRAWLTLPCPLLPPGCAGVVQPAVCHGFALLPRKGAAGTSPGLRLRGLQGTRGTATHPLRLPPAKGVRAVGSERTLSCPHSPTATPCPCANRGSNLGRGLCRGSRATLGIGAAVLCSGKAPRRGRQWQEQGTPKWVRPGGRGRWVPPGPPRTEEYLFIPSGAAPSGEASAQPWPEAFSARWGLRGGGAVTPWGGPATAWEPGTCPCSTLHGGGITVFLANQARAVPRGSRCRTVHPPA